MYNREYLMILVRFSKYTVNLILSSSQMK